MTSSEAIKLAHLDYEVKKRPMVYLLGGGKPGATPFYALVREDTKAFLGFCRDEYKVVQNVESFEWFDSIVGEGKKIFETAGALGAGERIFITAKLPETFQVKGDPSAIEQYLILTNGHDGFSGLTVLFSNVRVVCNNTLNMALSTPNKFTFRHTDNITQKMAQAAEMLGIHQKYCAEQMAILDNLCAKPVTPEQIDSMLNVAFLSPIEQKKLAAGDAFDDVVSAKKKNIINNVKAYIDGAEDQAAINGTAYGAFQGITGYFQNIKNWKDTELKMRSLILGEGASANAIQRSFEYLVKC
jgi:phage/plasmid-like protein (TIGR03299 family)